MSKLFVCKINLANKDRLLAKIPEHILEACMYREINGSIYLIVTNNMVLNLGSLLTYCSQYIKEESSVLTIDVRKYLDEIEKQE